MVLAVDGPHMIESTWTRRRRWWSSSSTRRSYDAMQVRLCCGFAKAYWMRRGGDRDRETGGSFFLLLFLLNTSSSLIEKTANTQNTEQREERERRIYRRGNGGGWRKNERERERESEWVTIDPTGPLYIASSIYDLVLVIIYFVFL